MKRDMDLIRELLLTIEDLDEPSLRDLLLAHSSNFEEQTIIEHLRLVVEEAYFVTGVAGHTLRNQNWADLKLTWSGHDFLDSIRDPEIWRKTKAGVLAGGGFTIQLLQDLAKGFIKKQIEDRTGVKL